MKCFDCGTDLTPDQRFCGNCGRQIKKRNDNGTRREASGASRQTFPIPEAEIAWKAWTAAEQKKHKNLMQKVRVASGIFMLVSGIYYWSQYGNANASIPAFVGGVMCAVAAVAFLMTWGACSLVRSENVYYTLPGSRDANGKHQCIFCGWRGVHKSTPYKTNSVVANCSKCSKHLWRD